MFKSKEEIQGFLKKKQFQKRIDQLSKKYTGKKVAFYGAGIVFDVIVDEYDLSSLTIEGVADIRFDQEENYKGYKAMTPESMAESKPDVVLITMYEPEKAQDYFEEELFPTYGEFQTEALIKFSVVDFIKDLLHA